MLKILSNFAILFVLLLVNIALFTWCVNQFEQPNLNINVQAKVIQYKPQPIAPIVLVSPKSQQVVPKNTAPSNSHNKQRLVLQFQSTYNQIDHIERLKLENMLNNLNISAQHSVDIFLGTAHSKKNISSPQTAKLRVQDIARVVYPYTQTVTMHYRPSMKEGKVIVEFLAHNPS